MRAAYVLLVTWLQLSAKDPVVLFSSRFQLYRKLIWRSFWQARSSKHRQIEKYYFFVFEKLCMRYHPTCRGWKPAKQFPINHMKTRSNSDKNGPNKHWLFKKRNYPAPPQRHWYINEITCKLSMKNTSMATKICLTVIRIHRAIFFKLIVWKFYLQKSIYIFQKFWLYLWKSCFVKQTKTVWYMLWCFVEALDRVGPAWPSPHRCRTFPLPLT